MSGTLIKLSEEGIITKHPVTHSGPPKWEEISELVGGYIERVKVKYEGRIRDAYLDEEGMIKNPRRKLNPHAYKLIADGYGRPPTQHFFGPLVIWVPDPRKKKDV